MKKVPVIVLAVLAISSSLAHSEEKERVPQAPVEKLVFETEWKGERIALPPEFAPGMKLKGIEEIRFAPGMFEPNSDEFFTYVFVFSVPKEQELTRDVIERETLVYYRGLAESVLSSRGKEVDASKFTFELRLDKEAKDVSKSVPDSARITQYKGKLDWIEPFATAKPQLLHFEIQAWADPDTAKNYLFVCTSPQDPGGDKAPIWMELRKLRREFEVQSE